MINVQTSYIIYTPVTPDASSLLLCQEAGHVQICICFQDDSKTTEQISTKYK